MNLHKTIRHSLLGGDWAVRAMLAGEKRHAVLEYAPPSLEPGMVYRVGEPHWTRQADGTQQVAYQANLAEIEEHDLMTQPPPPMGAGWRFHRPKVGAMCRCRLEVTILAFDRCRLGSISEEAMRAEGALRSPINRYTKCPVRAFDRWIGHRNPSWMPDMIVPMIWFDVRQIPGAPTHDADPSQVGMFDIEELA